MSLFKLKEVEQLTPLVGEFFHTGSRVICNPPPQDTDDDYIVLVGQGAIQYVQETLDQSGWKLGGSFDPRTNKLADSPEFVSYKKDEYNIILTTSQDYFESFKRATYLASHLNLLKKEDRVTLFEALVRDNYPTRLKIYGKTTTTWAEAYRQVEVRFNNEGQMERVLRVGNPDRDLERAHHDARIANHMQNVDRVGNPVLDAMIQEELEANELEAAAMAVVEEREAADIEQLLLEQDLDAERHAEFVIDLELEQQEREQQ